jgi:methanethiol S-methyltransferase
MPMVRFIAVFYSLICYAIGVAALALLILFIADLYVPVTVTTGSLFAPQRTGIASIAWNAALIAIWGAQQTFMASPGFKPWWIRFILARIERSIYLIFVAVMTVGLVAFWVPLPATIWDISGALAGNILLVVYFFGWAITLFATFLINHYDLFGLQQAWQQIGHTGQR